MKYEYTFISLGCDKNLVDTEVMLGMLASRGYQMVDEEAQADVIVINTCCFVHDAKEESIQNILEMAEYLSEIEKPVWIRHVLVPGGSDKDEYLYRLRDFIRTLRNVERVEVLPYHTLGVYKWKELGMEYPLEGIDPPSKERVENACRILETDKHGKS